MSELLGKIFGKDHKDHKSSKDKDKSQQGQDKGATGKWPDFCKYPVVYVLNILSLHERLAKSLVTFSQVSSNFLQTTTCGVVAVAAL